MNKYRLNLFICLVLAFCCCFISYGCGKKKDKKNKKTVATVNGSKQTDGSAQEKPLVPSKAPITFEKVYYDFEVGLDGWEIPMWAQGKTDYVAKQILISKDMVSNGESSMKLLSEFPGGLWSGALIEIQQYLDLSRYRFVIADIAIPEDAPAGLRAKLILTVGSNWKFVEMGVSTPLEPGKWVSIKANIEPGSYDWKRVVPDEEFSKDVRKIAIRIESNRKPKYSGPIYIDNIRMAK